MLLARLKLRLKKQCTRAGTKRRRFQVSLLDGNKKEEFQKTLKNRFLPLVDLEETLYLETY